MHVAFYHEGARIVEEVGRDVGAFKPVDRGIMEKTERQLLSALEELSAIAPAPLAVVLTQCADRVAAALSAEKVDAFLFDQSSQSLVAIGTSQTDMGRLQHRLGLNRLAMANGDPMCKVFETGAAYHVGRADKDPTQPRGIIESLEVRSMLAVPLRVEGATRGVLSVASRAHDAFTADDLSLLKIVSIWVGSLVQRFELIRANTEQTREHAKRATAEELITTVAHDLRNLLQPVSARAAVLFERLKQAGLAQDAERCTELLAGLNRLSGLMEDLLDVARLDRDILSLTYQRCELLELLHSTVQTLSLPGVPIQVESNHVALFVLADRRRLIQALENVLSNATKHSPRGVPVIVTVDSTKLREVDAARISIADRGPGIAPELLPRVFERYVAGGASSGLGLGLYLARALIEAHGGTIALHSGPAEGTRCELVIPLADTQTHMPDG
jgi:signal transduction histidine kinase